MKTPTTLIIMDGFGLSPSQAAAMALSPAAWEGDKIGRAHV